MEELVVGTVEYLPVEITDRLGVLTTLDGVTCQYKVTTEDEATVKVNWSACTTDDMKALPLIDTTGYAKAVYKLFVKVLVAPENPIVGPFEFAVI